MPTAQLQMPDGRIAEFDVPEGTTPEQVLSFAKKHFATTSATSAKPPSGIEAFNDRVKNAVAFGFGPAIDAAAGVAAGGVKNLFGGNEQRTYDDYLREYKARESAGREAHPSASLAGDVVGSLAGIATALPAKAVSAAAKAPGLLKQMGTGAKVSGGILGAQQAATTEGDAGDKIGAGILGAGAGGVLGASLPVVLRAGSSALSGLRSAGEAVKADPLVVASKQAARALQRDNVSLSDVKPGENLFQTGKTGVSQRLEAIATRANEGGDRIRNYAFQETQSLPEDLSVMLGPKMQEGNYPQLLQDIKNRALKNAKPAYKSAYEAHPVIDDKAIAQEIKWIKAANDYPTMVKEAKQLAAYDKQTFGGLDGKTYSLRDLDYMTRALRDLGQSTEGKGAAGAKTPIGASRSSAAMRIRDRLKQISPEFRAAVDDFGDEIAIKKAAEEGKKASLFGANFKDAMQGYSNLKSESAREAWRVGQAEKLHTMISNNPTSALKRFNSPQFRRAMGTIYTPDEMEAVSLSLSKRMREHGSLSRITGNSRTEPRRQMMLDDAVDTNAGGDVLSDVITQGPRRALINRFATGLQNAVSNTPVQQKADKLVADYILSTPFQLGARGATQRGSQIPLLQSLIDKNMATSGVNSAYNALAPGLLNRTLPIVAGGN